VNGVDRGVEAEKHIYVVLGSGDYTLAQAQASQPDGLPPIIMAHAILIGRIIVQKSASIAAEIDQVSNISLTTATVSAHNDLSSIQGGAAGDYQHLTSAELSKLSGIATGATANSADAQLRDRTTHTGTQAASTISDFNSATRAQVEAELVAGTNVTLTPSGSGATRQITIAATGGGGGSSYVPPALEYKSGYVLLPFALNGGTGTFPPGPDTDGFITYLGGSTFTSGSSLRLAPASNRGLILLPALKSFTLDILVKIPVLSNGTETFVFYAGMFSTGATVTNSPSSGLGLKISGSAVSLIARTGGVETVGLSTGTVTANTWTGNQFTVTYASGVLTLLQNGVVVTTLSSGFPSVWPETGLDAFLGWTLKTAGTVVREVKAYTSFGMTLNDWTPVI
jgi:hypothetical protein